MHANIHIIQFYARLNFWSGVVVVVYLYCSEFPLLNFESLEKGVNPASKSTGQFEKSPLSRLWSVLFKIYAKDTSKSLRTRTTDEYQAGKTLLTMLERGKINARNKNSYLEHQIFIITPFCGAKNESSLHMWPVPITGSVSKSWKYLSDKQSRHWLSGWLRWFHNTCLKSTWNELMACCCCRWW